MQYTRYGDSKSTQAYPWARLDKSIYFTGAIKESTKEAPWWKWVDLYNSRHTIAPWNLTNWNLIFLVSDDASK